MNSSDDLQRKKRRVFSSNYRSTSCNHSANILSNFLCLSHCPENKIWHLINTIQSSCPSLGQHKRLIRLYVWQEGNMLPFCTPRFSLLPHSTPGVHPRCRYWQLEIGIWRETTMSCLALSEQKEPSSSSAGIPVVFCRRGCFIWLSMDS